MKKFLSWLLIACMVFTMFPMTAFAADATTNVAKVGNTEYATIDEAIANWTNNSTLTLLADVTLSDVVTLNSTEHHILDLGTYTLTAASGKNAFVIKACGNGSAERTALTINADATNPGGVNAGSKSCVYYKYADGGISTEDRPIIKINGGVFTGSTSSFGTAGIYTIGTAARKCATLNIAGGTFNCSINGSGKSKLIVSGGTFNYSVGSQGDSTALRLISGGKFKTFGFMTADSNNTKFWIGTSMGNSNVGVYVDDNGYIVVGGPVITEAGDKFEASSANYSGASSYLQYSSAATNGLYYTSVEEALADNNKSTGSVTVYADKIDLDGINFKGTIVAPEGKTLTIINAPDGLKTEGNVKVVKGVGTENEPYLIETVEDLIFFRDSVNSGSTVFNAPGVWVALGADLDLNGQVWTEGIGDGHEYSFDGNFDGNGYTIANLTINPYADSENPETAYICGGLFGYTYGAVTIKNLVLDNVNVAGDVAGHNVGVLVGFANNKDGKLNVSNVTVKNSTINTPNANGVGAIVGYSYRSMGTIENCTVDNVKITGINFVGGITGYSYSDAVITGCSVNNATITATSKGAGGIAGLALNGNKITGNTVADTTVTAPKNWGYVVGELGAESAVVENNTAANPQVGGSYATGESYQAKIGDKYYTTIAAAIDAATEGQIIAFVDDIDINSTISVPAGKKIVLDLNGKTITGTDESTASFSLISNKGDLTIKDSVGNGKITLKATNDREWNAYSSVISNTVGGKLTVESGMIEHLGGTDMAYGIDNLTNGKGTYAETVIDGGTIKSTYRAIRQFLNGVEAQNILTVNGGTIEGANKSIWMQDPSKNANTGTLTVGASATLVGDVYLFVTAGSTDWPVTVSISKDALADGYSVVSANVPDNKLVNTDGGVVSVGANPAYGKVAQIGDVYFETLSDAFAAVQSDNDTIIILADVTENLTGSYLRGNIVAKEGKNVTITLTNSDWVYCPYTFVLGANVTLKAPAFFYYAGGSVINGTLIVDAYYQRYAGTKLTINEPGSMTVNSETFIVRYMDGDPNAGIYVVGDNNPETVGLKASVVYFYQGTISAQNANLEVGVYWQTNETDGQGTANLVLDNSKLNVTVNEHDAKATGNSTVTLKNGSILTCANGFVYGNKTVISVNDTSKIVTKNGPIRFVASINGVSYKTLADAIAAVKNGETITLLTDVSENVTLTEKTGLYYTIDGNGKTMNGTITVTPLSDTNDNRRITIKNINFVDTADANVDFISSVATNHYPRLTIEGCTFTGSGNDGDVAVRLKSSHSVVIKDCTGTGLHSFLQNTSGWNLTIENVKVTDSKSGLALGTVQGVTVKGCTIDVNGYGIRLDAQYNNNAVIESNKVDAFIPVVVRKAEVVGAITFAGANTMTASNTDGIWMAVGTSEYEKNGKMPTDPAAVIEVTLNDTGLDADGIYNPVIRLVGAGTESDPYIINNVEDLIFFRNHVNAGETKYNASGVYVALTSDIDMSGINWNVNIGDGANATFDGIFDGKNFTIKNLNSTETAQTADGYVCTGLFGAIAGNAVIKNLIIENVEINTNNYTGNNVAAVVGFAWAATGSIENVTVKGNIQINANKNDGVGVIVGYAYGGKITVKNCTVDGAAVTRSASAVNGQAYVGGIIGYASENAVVSNNTVQNIAINATSCAAGGVAGILCSGGVAKENVVKNVTLTSAHANWEYAVGTVAGTYYGTIAIDKTYAADNSTTALVGVIHANKPTSPLAPAPSAAQAVVNNVYYASLTDAFAVAVDGDEVVILAPGTYALNGISGKNITVTGAVDGVVFDNIGAFGMGGANVTFKNITFDYYPNVNYTGLQHSGNLVYNNCTLNGQVFLYGNSETFNDCTFNQNSADAYNVWTYGAKEVKYNNCTFNSAGKSVLVYTEEKTATNDVAFTNSTFNATAAVEGKAAIEIDTSLSAGAKITIDAATTATGFGTGNVSGNSLWNNKKDSNTDATNDLTVIVNGETVLGVKTFVAKIGETGYTSIADAIKAANAGETVTILAGDYNQDISVNKAITVVGATDAEGNNLVNITGRVSASSGATVENLNVHNDKTGTYDCALVVNGSDIVIDGVNLSGYNGMRYCYAKGDITIKNSTINGSNFAVHFDGSNGGNITFDECDITGWVSYGGGVDTVTLKDSTFDAGSYAGQRSYAEKLVIEGCTFEAGYKLDITATTSDVTVTDSKMSDGSAILNVFNKDDLCGQASVTIDGEAIAYVAKIGNDYYATLEEALANVADWTTIKLVANATLDYGARDVYGRDTTTDIIIDGQGFTLTLNQTNSDWSSIGMKNADGKLTLKNMTIEKTGKGDTSGAWNTHAIIFSSNVEMKDVTVNNAIAVQNGATLNNVTINEANGYYGLWINGNGQTVTVNGGAINATNGGRGIKIADQYIDAPASVTLNVTGTVFNTAKKAAVLVSSTAGANITASNVDIANVAADSTNFVWVDEDWAADYGNVTVNGAPAALENADDFTVAITENGAVLGYFKTLAAAFAAADAGDTITLLAPIVVNAGETLELNKNVIITYTSKVVGEDMITNRGTLIIDGTTVVYENKDNGGSNVTVSTISCEPGSVLKVKSGSVINNSANNASKGIYAYAIDLVTNGNLGDVTATISGGEVVSTNYMAIRQFANSNVCKNVLNVTGGTIKGGTRGINIQIDNNMAYTNISGGEIEGANYSICFITSSENIAVSGGNFKGAVYYGADGFISGGTFDAPVYEGYCEYSYIPVANSDGTYGVKGITIYNVATKAELDSALAKAVADDKIILTADIDYGTTQLAISKAITLDLGGNTLTTRNAYGGMSLKNNPTIKNGTIVHASNTAAIKAWNVASFEDLVIDVQGKGDANKTIGGIVIQSGNTSCVGSIKNVTIKGTALTNGIETYNCGDAVAPVIGSMANVTIDAVGTGMLISAPCGTATDCSIKGGTTGIEIWIKGNYSATLELVNCDVTGGEQAVYAHDEFASNVVNNGTLSLVADEETEFISDKGVKLTFINNNDSEVEVPEELTKNVVATINGKCYESIDAAIKAAKAGDTIKVVAGTYAVPSMKAGITIEGVGEVIFEGTLSGTLEDLTLKNIHIKGANAQRWAYAKGDLVFENVTFEATSVYALHFDGITEGATLSYKDCTIIGWAAMSGSPESCVFDGCTFKGNGTYGVIRTYFDATIENCTFDVANVNTTDNYQDGIHAVSGAEVIVNNCTNVNGTMKDIANVSGSSVVVVDGVEIKNGAKINGVYYVTFNDAVAAAQDGDEIEILVAGTYKVPAGKDITITGAVAGVEFDMSKAVGINASMTFNNVTFNYGNANYKGLQHAGTMVYNNCTFNGQVFLYGNSETFNNCTFNQNSADAYNVWTYGAKEVNFNGCTFNSAGKSVLVYTETKTATNDVTVTNSTFNATAAVEGKAAIEIDTSLSAGAKITIDAATTATGFGTGNVSGNSLWNNKKGSNTDANNDITVVVDDVTVLAPVTFVAYIGKIGYTSLADAFAAANAGDEVKILKAGTYALTGISGKNITVTGAVDGVVFDNIGAFNMGGADVTFNKVTFNYADNSTYKGLQHAGDLVYNNCTFNGQVFLYGESETFNSCTFNQTTNNYNVWTYGAKEVDFNGCTFNSAGKSVLIYAESANVFNNVNVTDCAFNASAAADGKAAIEMDSSLTSGINLTIANSTATGFANGNVSGNSLWNNKKGSNTDANNDITVVVDDVTVLAPVKFVAYIGNIGYTSINDAIKAANAGETVTILAGNYTQNINVNKAITVVGETDAEGNNLVQINGTLSIKADGVTVKNLNVKSTGKACQINAKNVLIEGCNLEGSNGLYQSYTSGTVTFKDSTITGATYGIHFDGSANGNIVIDNCVIKGWTSFAKAIDKVTISNTEFADGSYDYLRFYQDAELTNVKFNPNMTVDFAVTGVTADFTGCTVTDGSDLVDIINKDDLCGQNEVTINGEKIAYVAKIGNAYYETLEEALANVADWTTIKLVADATLDYGAREAYGRDTTTDIIIDGQGFTLTLNQTNSDWSSIGMKNADGKLTLKNMTIEKTGKGDTSGAWNTHAIIFSSNVEMKDVTVNNAIAVQNGATLNNVTINEANGYYGLWINGNGQTVTVNGGAINATNGGRGIKIADQYIDAPASVTLNVTGTKFSTAKKAAVLVSSTAGANITASGYDISNVAEDTVNFVWVDEDWAADYGKVTVTGGTKTQEGIEKFIIIVTNDDGDILGYYKTIADAVAGANDGETVVVTKSHEIDCNAVINEATYGYSTLVYVNGKNITLDFAGNTVTVTPDLSAMLVSVVFVGNGGNLTVKDSVGNGGFMINEGTDVYSLFYNSYSTLTIVNGNYIVEELVTNGSLIYADKENTTAVKGGFFELGNAANDSNTTKPWIFNVHGKNEGNFIVVTGGIFNQNILMNQGTAKDCEVEAVCLVLNEGNGTWIAKAEHNVVTDAAVDATCTQPGLKEGSHCSACGNILVAQEVIEELGHTYVIDEAVAPTCTDAGKTAGTHCSVCNVVFVAQTEIPALGHNWVDASYDAPKTCSVCGAAEGNKLVAVAKIGETKYESLADAIAAANAGDTIVLVADVAEDVIINKNLTIDGAGKNYTGTMSGNDNLTVTVENVNFVNGGFAKDTKSAKGSYTFKNCTFDGAGEYAYALTIRGANVVKVEDCTVANYMYGFLYVRSSANKVAVNNVTVDNCSTYAVYLASGVGTATFENVTVKNSDKGFLINNTANRAFTIKNCTMENVGTAISESNGTNTITCTALGNNNFGTAAISQYAKIVLAAEDATLTAPAGYNVTTTVEGYNVAYKNGAYVLVEKDYVAEVNGTKYESLADAIAAANNGDVITVIADHEIDGSKTVTTNNFGYDTLIDINGKEVTIDFNGHTVTVVPNAPNANGGIKETIESIIFVENGASLTLKGEGGFKVEKGTALYSFIYNCDSTVVIESGNYNVVETIVAGAIIYADNNQTTIVNGGYFTLGNAAEDADDTTKPWIFNTEGKNESFVYVTGGTFNQNLLMNLGTAKDCEVIINDDSCLYLNQGNGTWTVQTHNVVTDAEVAPTCSATGLTAGSHCANCGEVFVAQTVVDKVAHTAGAEATCTEAQICTVCNEVLVAANGHTVTIVPAVAPTCTETGLTTGVKCSGCDLVYLAQETVDALGHTWTEATIDAPKTCTVCGATDGEALAVVAKIGDVTYATLAEALNAAAANDTVVLVADTAEDLVKVNANVTLNLNGHYVTAKNVLSFGDIIDNDGTTDGLGGIKISNNRADAFVQLQKGNTYLPLYDAANGCYRFYEYKLTILKYVVNGSEGVITYKMRLVLSNNKSVYAYKLLADTANSGITLSVALTWTNNDNPVIYTITKEKVAEFADKVVKQLEKNEKNTMVIGLNIYGIDRFSSGNTITGIQSISSVTGVSSVRDDVPAENYLTYTIE